MICSTSSSDRILHNLRLQGLDTAAAFWVEFKCVPGGVSAASITYEGDTATPFADIGKQTLAEKTTKGTSSLAFLYYHIRLLYANKHSFNFCIIQP